MSYKIMIVDDEPANLRLLERLFRRDYTVISASSGEEALRLLEQHDVALLITDQRMPGMTGIELLKHTAPLRPHMVRIILTGYTDVTSLVEAINCGQVYKYVTKPWDNEVLRLTVSRALEHYETSKSRHELALTNLRLVGRMKEMTRGFVRAIADALEAKDEYVHGHARRVRSYAASVGRQLGLDEEALEQLALAAFLHDIGKIGTPDSILLKPGPLTPDETAQVRRHARRGARMLTGIVGLEGAADAVLHHHEHFDGTGYPDGLSGERIPLLSRIILVADAYDAMTSPRPFREALTHEEAVARLSEGAGTRFDPEVVRVFCEFEPLARIRKAIAAGPSAATAKGFEASGLNFDELTEKVSCDPLLAALVLRAANAAYGLCTANLDAACSALGLTGLRAAIEGGVSQGEEGAALSDEQWEHSLRAAEAARLIAEQTRILDSKAAYTLGLLHDVGQVLLDSLFPATAAALAGLDVEERGEYEAASYGIDHAQVGQWALEACGVPRQLAAAVQAHHDVDCANDPAALLLHVADRVAHADDPFKVAALDSISTERLYLLGLSRHDLFRVHALTGDALERRLNPVI
ncbi:MAG: HDOD domain-containing protein [Acidobacteria bacterium]|nr:HDOD domain-containing protein [Acidobacteriota bacterium]